MGFKGMGESPEIWDSPSLIQVMGKEGKEEEDEGGINEFRSLVDTQIIDIDYSTKRPKKKKKKKKTET